MYKLRKILRTYYFRQMTAMFLITCLFFGPVTISMASTNPGADALPSGVIDSSGIGSFDNSIANQLNITQIAGEAVINWNNFDIGTDSMVQFIQPDSTAAVLNRVHDGSPTGIMGSLTANGRIFIVNPAGVVFGGGSTVNVSQLVASSLNITDEDFINGRFDFTGAGIGEIANYGSIEAAQGVALIGRKVLNAGSIISGQGGFVVMTAGDRVLLGQPGSKIVVEMSSVLSDLEGSGDVINEGQIDSDGGTIVLASGDLFSMAAELDSTPAKISTGTGRVGQFGTITADGVDSDGGNITLTAADTVVLGQDSVTTANAGTNGDGGDVVVYSPDTALFRSGALVEAKGGAESGNGGFFDLSGKEYVEVMGDIDLTAANGGSGMFLIDPLDLWVVDLPTVDPPIPAIDVVEDPTGSNIWKPTNSGSVSQLDVDALEVYLDGADVTLSTLGTPDGVYPEGHDLEGLPQYGDIVFDFATYGHGPLTSGASGESDSSLIVIADHDIEFREGSSINFAGDGDVELYASTRGDSPDYDGAVITTDRGKNPPNIWTNKGNIIVEAGSGGIDMGMLKTGTPTTAGEEAEIRLTTINGDGVTIDHADKTDTEAGNAFDITVQSLDVKGNRLASVYVESAGDLTINGDEVDPAYAVDARTNTASLPGDDNPARSYVCLIADGDVDITGAVTSWAKSDTDSTGAIWIGAGTNAHEPAVANPYPGTVTVDGKVEASAFGDDTGRQDASIRVYASVVDLKGNVLSKTKNTQYPKQGDPESGLDSKNATYSADSTDPRSEDNSTTRLYDKLDTGSRALVDIDRALDGSCLTCANRTIIFYIEPDQDTVDWFEGYTIVNIDGVLKDTDPAILDVLANDDKGVRLDTSNVNFEEQTTDLGGTVKWSLYTDNTDPQNPVTYWVYEYTPPSYDVKFEWNGTSEYATFTDSFKYNVAITDRNGELVWAAETAEVTITVQNAVPTLADGVDQTIHMNTDADFDVSTLVTDIDGTPGGLVEKPDYPQDVIDGIAAETLAGTLVGTYGDLTYGVVDGLIPVSNGSIETDNVLLSPYYGAAQPLVIDEATITYTPIDGYVSPTGEPTTFGYFVTDDNIKKVDAQGATVLDPAEFVNADSLNVTVTNAGPTGAGYLGTTTVNNGITNVGLVEGGFTDDLEAGQSVADTVSAVSTDGTPYDGASYLTGNSSSEYGGELTYDALTNTWVYTPDTTNLDGYFGDDDTIAWGEAGYGADEQFTVDLTDGQMQYTLVNDDTELEAAAVTNGTALVSLDIDDPTSQSGSAFFGTVHMDTIVTDVALTDPGTLNTDLVATGTPYGGTVYGGATLEWDGTDWTYTPDDTPITGQTGYTGDSVDNWGEAGYLTENQDETFTFELDTDGVTTYLLSDGNPGFLDMSGPGDTPKYGHVDDFGTVTVELSNAGPEAVGGLAKSHMAIAGTPLVFDLGQANDTVDNDTDFPEQTTLDELTVVLNGNPIAVGGTLETEHGTTILVKDGDIYYFEYTARDGATGTDTFSYTVSDGELGTVPQEATLTIDLTNTRPSGNVGLTTHMDDPIVDGSISGSFSDDNGDPITIGIITASDIGYNKTFGGDLAYNGSEGDNGTASEWDYDPAAALPGYVGDDEFDVQLWDGEYDYIMVEGPAPEGYEFVSEGEGYNVYRAKEYSAYSAGTVTVDLTNTPPTAGGNLGQTPQNTQLIVDQDPPPPTGTSNRVFVNDDDAPLDSLSIVQAIIPDHYTGSAGGTLEFDGNQWIYTPAPGHTGTEEFTVQVWDGQNNYEFVEGDGWIAVATPEYGDGPVTVNVEEALPAAAPLPVFVEPKVEGCPVLLDAAALELGITTETIQVSIGRALALSPNIQPCEACENLMNSASVLMDPNGSKMAAMAQVFNQIAPLDVPPTDEMFASIAIAFAENTDNPQYAAAYEYAEAFVQYIAAMDELGAPVGDPTTYTLNKYGGSTIEENGNISAYIMMRLEALGG